MDATFLIIDDSPADCFLTKRCIKKINPSAEILEASDGREGLEILETHGASVDLILLDINMPRMNGHEFIQEYNGTYGEHQGPVVVMLTSSDQQSDKSRALAFEFVKNYVLKPLSPDDMQSVVANALTAVEARRPH